MLLLREKRFEIESSEYAQRIWLILMSSGITSGTFMSENNLPEREQLLSAAAHLQILPGSTLVGGTAVAIFAQHRISHDADHLRKQS